MKDNKLASLRKEIEKIDNNIIDSLSQRIEVVKQIGQLKKSSKTKKNTIVPKREFEVLSRILQKSSNSIPKSTIISIWRKIISSSILVQENIKIAIHNPTKNPEYKYIAQNHYGDFFEIQDYDSQMTVFQALENNEAQVGIFRLPNNKTEEQWWINLINNKNNLQIFSIIPCFKNKNDTNEPIELVTIGKIQHEKTGQDETLLALEVSKNFSTPEINSLLKQTKNNYKILQKTNLRIIPDCTFYLIKLDGFIEQQDAIIQTLQNSELKPHIKILGYYAKQIVFTT